MPRCRLWPGRRRARRPSRPPPANPRLEVERALATQDVIDTPEKWSFSLPWLFTHMLGQFAPEGQTADAAGLARGRGWTNGG